MISFIYADKQSARPELFHAMYQDRARQFHDRLGWNVSVNEDGEEVDEYDKINPLYVIVSNGAGRHEASMRLLPTTGKTMVHDHFLHLTDGVRIESPLIWECTRFCIAPNATSRAAIKLMAAGAKVMREFCLNHYIGVFDRKMLPVYRRIGSTPTVLGWSDGEINKTGVGLWFYSHDVYLNLLKKGDLSECEMELYFVNSDLAEGSENESTPLVA